MNDFVKKSDLAFSLQLINFANKLPAHQVVLGLTAADVTEATKASNYFKWVLDQQTAHAERIKNWTAYKDILRSKEVGAPANAMAPVTLVVPAAPAAAPLGIENWFRAIVKRIKGSQAYTNAIGQDLGIVASASVLDTDSKQPKMKIQLVAGQPLIIWKKDGMDGVQIYKDSGDGNWKLLQYDTRPNHLDNSPLPEVGATATWKYKAIYLYKDEQVGMWSDEISVTVTGTV